METWDAVEKDIVPVGFSPLAGIRYVETTIFFNEETRCQCFSPLAGIRYVETHPRHHLTLPLVNVSVPLRGLDMWKHEGRKKYVKSKFVSVPLRGLDMWKLSIDDFGGCSYYVSVPLRGLDMWKPE